MPIDKDISVFSLMSERWRSDAFILLSVIAFKPVEIQSLEKKVRIYRTTACDTSVVIVIYY
jgi:hypothetical protein